MFCLFKWKKGVDNNIPEEFSSFYVSVYTILPSTTTLINFLKSLKKLLIMERGKPFFKNLGKALIMSASALQFCGTLSAATELPPLSSPLVSRRAALVGVLSPTTRYGAATPTIPEPASASFSTGVGALPAIRGVGFSKSPEHSESTGGVDFKLSRVALLSPTALSSVVIDKDEVSSSSHSTGVGSKGLMERAVEILMRQLGLKLPEVAPEHEVERQSIDVTYHTVIGACLGTLNDFRDAAGIVDLQSGLLIYCNTAMQSIFGLLQKELMFRLLTDFFVLEEEEKAPFLEGIRTILKHGQVTSGKKNFRYSGNITGWLYNGATTRQNRLEYTISHLRLPSCLDHITQENQLSTIFLRHYEPEYQLGLDARIADSVFANCPLGIVRADFYGMIKDANPATLFMFNLSRQRILGQNVTIFMPEGLRQSHNLFLEAFRRRIAVKPDYSSKIVNNNRVGGHSFFTTKTWDGRTLNITLDVRVIDQALVAFIRDNEALVLGDVYRQALVKNSFPPMLARKYFADKVPDSKEGLQIEVNKKAVMSIDLVNSTEKFAEYSARDHYQIMNAYLSELDKVVALFQGVTIKHTGDGLLAIFDPIYKEKDFAKFAGLCALACLGTANEWNKRSPFPLKTDDGKFYLTRIGVCSGDFLISVVGQSSHLADIDVMGQTVVTACRLQAVAEPGTAAIDPHTYQLAKIGTTKKGLLKDQFVKVTLDSPLKGLTLEGMPALYRSISDKLTPEIVKAIREKGAALVEEAAESAERLAALHEGI